MCSASNTLNEWPATEALDRCLKRRRTTTLEKEDNNETSESSGSLSFDSVFCGLSTATGELAFPSISWSFDDDDDERQDTDSQEGSSNSHSQCQAALGQATWRLSSSTRQASAAGLVRSKSIVRDLSRMSSTTGETKPPYQAASLPEALSSTVIEPLTPSSLSCSTSDALLCSNNKRKRPSRERLTQTTGLFPQ